MLYFIYRRVTALSSPVLNRLLDARLQQNKEDPSRVAERRGQAVMPRPDGKLMWFHGASVGESLSVLPLVNTLKARLPDWHFMLTSGTVTSAEMMAKRLPQDVIHQYIPLDHPKWVKHFVEHWNPDAVIWLESELWPNLLHEIRTRDIPAALINARMNERSARRWRYARSLIRTMLQSFTFILTGARNYVPMFKKLGGENVHYIGSLKFGAQPLPIVDEDFHWFAQQTAGRLCIGFLSTQPTEELLAGTVYKELKRQFPNMLAVIVPRNVTRSQEVAEELRGIGLQTALRSAQDHITDATDVYIADTMGEMGMWLQACPLVVMGGSFVPKGGQNPLEATHFGAAVLYGPHMFNFPELCLAMEEAGAAESVAHKNDLLPKMQEILGHPEELARRREASRNLAGQNMSVIDAYADEIVIQLVEKKP